MAEPDELTLEGWGLRVVITGPRRILAGLDAGVVGLRVGASRRTGADRHYEVTDAPDGRFVLRCAGAPFTGAPSPRSHVVAAIRDDVLAFVSAHARTHAFVHAGAVGWRGRAIVLPGRSMTGKSTLVAALLRAGATYCSDEFAPLAPDGRLHPYPRSLSLRPESGGAAATVEAETIGAAVETEPLLVGAVVVMPFERGVPIHLEDRRPSDAVLALLDNAVAARIRPAAVLPALGRAVVGARVAIGIRGDADAAAAAIIDWLA